MLWQSQSDQVSSCPCANQPKQHCITQGSYMHVVLRKFILLQATLHLEKQNYFIVHLLEENRRMMGKQVGLHGW